MFNPGRKLNQGRIIFRMSDNKKDKASATIVELMALDDSISNKDEQTEGGRPVTRGKSTRIKDRLRLENMLVPGSNLGQIYVDQYRRIKRPLLSNAYGKSSSLVERGNLILVTSSIPGEGKTHTAINLALSIAQERDHTVLLVDCDVSKKGTSHKLGIENTPGLTEVLKSDTLTIGDVIMRTDITELSVISAGKHDEYVTEYLASERMSELVDEMASRYEDRVIIFDGPPMLPTPETQVLAGLVGQVAFVVETGKTPQMLVENALTMIPEEKAVGLVLNKTEGVQGDSGYYYGYYAPDAEA